MKLLTQVGETCMLYSAAMLLDITTEMVIKEIGHDGSEILWPKNDKHLDMCAAYHIQEIQDICMGRGYALASIEVWPIYGPNMDEFLEVYHKQNDDLTVERFFNCIKNRKALLILECNEDTKNENRTHACAWDGKNIYDPNGSIYPPEDLESVYEADWNIREAWILTKLI